MQRGAAPDRKPFVRDPEKKRARILAVSRRLFANQPYDVTTTAEIARLADVAEGTLFHHFHSKPELLRAVAEDYACDLLEAMFGGALGERLSFRLSFERSYEFIRKEGLPAFHPGRDAEPQRIVYEVLEERLSEKGADLLEELARRGSVRPSSFPTVARWIFSIYLSLLADALCRGRSAVSAEQLAEAARWIEGGLGVRESADAASTSS